MKPFRVAGLEVSVKKDVSGSAMPNSQKQRQTPCRQREGFPALTGKSPRIYPDGRYEDALGEVALAFIVNPFDEDVKEWGKNYYFTEREKSARDRNSKEDAVQKKMLLQ